MRYQSASGMTNWCKAQMDVRYTQSVYIRQGTAEEEAPLNISNTDGDPHIFTCDLILGNEASALDAFATLTSASLMAWLENSSETSWVEYHICDHDEDNRSGCLVAHRKEYENQTLSKEIINGVVQ